MNVTKLIRNIGWHINNYKNCMLSMFIVFPNEWRIKNQYRCYKWAVRQIVQKSGGWRHDIFPCKARKEISGGGKNIWVYWNSGEDNAPAVVKKCINSMRNNTPEGYVLHVLDFEKLLNLVDFPEFILDKRNKGIIPEAQFSDLARSCLLYLYGGIWMDATCYMTSHIPDNLLKQKFFMFQTDLFMNPIPIISSNWFILSEKRNRILELVSFMLIDYWYRHNRLMDYFIYHIFLKALYDVDEYVRKEFYDMPYISNQNPHIMQFSLQKAYDRELLNHITSSCFVHKLTYKIKKDNISRNSLLYHILYNDKD